MTKKIPYKLSYYRVVNDAELKLGIGGRIVVSLAIAISIGAVPVYFFGVYGLLANLPYALWLWQSEYKDIDDVRIKQSQNSNIVRRYN